MKRYTFKFFDGSERTVVASNERDALGLIGTVCKGSYALGTACGRCARCIAEANPVPFPGWQQPGVVSGDSIRIHGGTLLALLIAAEDCAAALEADAAAANTGRECHPVLAKRYAQHVEPAQRLRALVDDVRREVMATGHTSTT